MPAAVAPAQATLDIRLAALAAGLEVQTEQELPYGDDQVLRPDNLVTLANGGRAIFETEQAAELPQLRRIVESVRHMVAFFDSVQGRQVSSTVRVLINLPPGQAWERTVTVWERATAIVADDRDGRLPFRLLALPLSQFLAQPDWAEPPDVTRWESLFDPAKPIFRTFPIE